MTKILMHGCNGKIGQVLSKLTDNNPDFKIVAGVDVNLSPFNNYPVFSSLKDCNKDNKDIDVIIDFSTASAVPLVLNFAKERKIPVVICTTGLDEEQMDLINETSKFIPIFFSSNMSLGVNLLISLATRAAEVLCDCGFDIEIVEKHHNQKIDAPSGTALSIANAIQETLNNEFVLAFDRSKIRQARNKKEIGVHAIRGGTIVGEHDIIFAGTDEVITLSHTATSKDVFAIGALKAAKFIMKKSPSLYNMGHLLER